MTVWRVGSAVMLAALAIWLIASRDQEGRLNENFLLVTFIVLGLPLPFQAGGGGLIPADRSTANKMIEPTENDIGRGVVYTGNRYPGGKLEARHHHVFP